LDAPRFRELAYRLTASWTTNLWKDAPEKEELEGKLACAATSLSTIATVTAPWLRERIDVDEFDYALYKQLPGPLKELRPVFASLKDAYEAGEERRAWEKLVEEYNKLRRVDPDQGFFADWTPLQVLRDLGRRYKVWALEETPLWERTVERLGLEGSVRRDAGVLRVRAKLPHVGSQEGLLRKILYSIHGGVEDPAAVLWEDKSEDAFQWAAMVLCPDHKAALEIHLRKRRPGPSHFELADTYSKRACTHSSLFIVVQSDSDGVLQRHRMALCPRCLKRLLPKCLAGRSHGALVFDALGRWERPTPILAQRASYPTEPGCPLHPPLRDRYSGQPLEAD